MHVDVYEASDGVGGLARSISLWGQTVDLGPHRFFSRDRRVNALWLEVVGRDYAIVRRQTRILYRGRFFRYPLEPLDALVKLGPVEAVRCGGSYLAGRLGGQDPHPGPLPEGERVKNKGSFEEWVVGRFGRRLFEVFFKSYSEKLWGIRCDELDADFAAQRIRRFSLAEAVRAAFFSSGRRKHATLVDEFAYPLGGTGMVYERMRTAVEARGGRVFLRTPVARVLVEGGRVRGIELADGSVRRYDAVVSTMPLTQLVERLPEAPAEVRQAADRLTFRNTILVYLEVAGEGVFPDQWIYIHDPGLRTGRITNFRNWAPQLCGDSPNTILALELWCNSDDELWRAADDTLIERAKRELRATALVGEGRAILNGAVVRIPKCYPVYRRGYREHLAPIQQYLSTIEGLFVIGRYGAFKYNNQDHSILMGLLAAENVLTAAGHDLWAVNSDYETYQEETRITQAGLARV